MYSNPYIITKIHARQILDSRSTPTVEADVYLTGNVVGRASVPAGASRGSFEAKELRNKRTDFYLGCSVLGAVRNINDTIADSIVGMNAFHTARIDKALISLDGSDNKQNLGANAILAVSLACARAAAKASRLPLYRYLGGVGANLLPIPMMNILNGGVHASSSMDIQEFMIVPAGVKNFRDAIRCGCEIYHALKKILKLRGLSTAIGDEGGFAPNLESDREAIEVILEAIELAGYEAGYDVFISLDVAASEWYDKEKDLYVLPKQKQVFTKQKLIDYWSDLCECYPIYSLEDPFHEDDFESMQQLTQKIGNKVLLVGDDMFVTNAKRLKKAAENGVANAILIKPNQIGSLSETINTVNVAKSRGYKSIISHRSGETEDTFIADLAVALSCGHIKAGAPCRVDRTAKYNRLLRIEESLGADAIYYGNLIK